MLCVNQMLQLRDAELLLHPTATLMSYDLRSTQSKARWAAAASLCNRRAMASALAQRPARHLSSRLGVECPIEPGQLDKAP